MRLAYFAPILAAILESGQLVSALSNRLDERGADSPLLSSSSLEDIVRDPYHVSDHSQPKTLSAVVDLDLVSAVDVIKRAVSGTAASQASSRPSDTRGGDSGLGELTGFRTSGVRPVKRDDDQEGYGAGLRRSSHWGELDEAGAARRRDKKSTDETAYMAGLRRADSDSPGGAEEYGAGL